MNEEPRITVNGIGKPPDMRGIRLTREDLRRIEGGGFYTDHDVRRLVDEAKAYQSLVDGAWGWTHPGGIFRHHGRLYISESSLIGADKAGPHGTVQVKFSVRPDGSVDIRHRAAVVSDYSDHDHYGRGFCRPVGKVTITDSTAEAARRVDEQIARLQAERAAIGYGTPS